MANTIANFLVGLGLDTSEFEAGEKKIDSGISNLKSSALQLAAVGASAFGAQQLTFGFAQATDNIGKFSRVFSILPEDVSAFGRALEHEGGTLAGFMSQIENLERLRAMTPDQIGGFFAQAGVTGIDPNLILEADNVTEAYLRLADVFAGLNQRERIKASELFGFDEASIRLLSSGRAEVEKLVEREKELRPITEQMTKESARFNDVTQDLGTNIGNIADTISISLLPAISDVVEDMNEWLEVNKQFINSGIDTVLEPIADNLGAIATAGGLLATGGLLTGLAGMAKYVPVVGKGLAVAAGAAGKIAGIGAAAVIGAEVVEEAAPGGALSASNIFGDNVVTRLLDTPISQLFGTDDDVTPLSSTSNNNQSNNQRPVMVQLTLDGQVIDQKIVNTVNGMAEDAIVDVTSSTGG